MGTRYPHECHPGDMFAVRLERGGYGVMLVARQWRDQPRLRPPLFVGVYGFDRIFDEVPDPEVAQGFSILDSIHTETCSDMYARLGRWPYLGRKRDFDPDVWLDPPTAFVLNPGSSGKPWYPTEVDDQRVVIPNADAWCDVNIAASRILRRGEFEQLPPMSGVGDAKILELTFDLALRDRTLPNYFKVTPERLATWHRVLRRAKRLGLYPIPEPEKPKRPTRRRRKTAVGKKQRG